MRILTWTIVAGLAAWWVFSRRKRAPSGTHQSAAPANEELPIIWGDEAGTPRPPSPQEWPEPGAPAVPVYEPPPAPAVRPPCGTCGGNKVVICRRCKGNGGWWVRPQTATDVARWESCGTCMGSGSVTCTSCNGSGQASW